ncbi:MAG: hypothetical protein K9L30_05445 [Desulfobacterales bacterium]|nr:hypothetical protein [Desulfobacterales bacterium]
MAVLYNRIYILLIIFILIMLVGCFPVCAADILVRPDNDQRPEKQAYDKNECHNWAVRQSGIDPNRVWMEEADERHAPYEEQNKRDNRIFTGEGFIGAGPYWETVADKDTRTAEKIEQEREQKRKMRDKQTEKYYRLLKECLEKRYYTVEIR